MLILHMKLILPKSSQHSAEYILFVWLYTVEFNRLPFPNDKMYDDAAFADRFRYSLTTSGNRVWIGIPRLLYVHIAYEIDSAKISAAFCRISYCLYDLYGWIQSTAVFERQNLRWCSFRWSISLSIDYVWESSIDSVITTPSCSYCICNRYFQNHRSILPNFLLFALFDTVEFKRLPCSNNKRYDNIVFADRFRYKLTMFEVCVLIWLSQLAYTHSAYEIFI